MRTPDKSLAALSSEAIPLVLKQAAETSSLGSAEEIIQKALNAACEYHRTHPPEDGFGDLPITPDLQPVVERTRAEHLKEHKEKMAGPFVKIGVPLPQALEMVEALLREGCKENAPS